VSGFKGSLRKVSERGGGVCLACGYASEREEPNLEKIDQIEDGFCEKSEFA
jgi:hypothetical protein